MRFLAGSLLLSFAAAAPAVAQPFSAPPPAEVRPLRDFRVTQVEPPDPRREGLVAAWPIGRNLDVAIGRFAVPPLPRRRSNMASEERHGETRRRDRGIAAVGFSLRF